MKMKVKKSQFSFEHTHYWKKGTKSQKENEKKTVKEEYIEGKEIPFKGKRREEKTYMIS